MAFLIPDNLKSRPGVPASIQRAANAFQIGLDETAVVWYEPLFDPKGEKPHLVVLIPDRGIIILESLEARAEKILGVLKGKIRLRRDDVEIEVNNPLQRAQNLADILKQRVALETRLSGIFVPVACGAIFGALTPEDAVSKGLDRIVPSDQCLFKPHLDDAIAGKGEAQLLRAFTKMLGGASGERIPQDKEKLLRGLIQPEIVIDKVASSSKQATQLTVFRPPEGSEDILRVMDREQEAMAKSLGDGHRIIRGVAGSGKTLVLIYRAQLLARLYPSDKILVTCYTKSLAGQLKALLKDHSNIDVINLDKLMWDTTQAAGLHPPRYKDDASGDLVAEVALRALSRGAGPRYRAVLLDEAQDFGTNTLRFALGLLRPGVEDLIVVADSAQNIFRRKFSWRQAGIQAQGRTRILRTNYRNTKEILEFASKFLLASSNIHTDENPDPEDENAIIPPESAARTGEKPILYICENLDMEIRKVIDQISEWSKKTSTPRSIAVIHCGPIEIGRPVHDKLSTTGHEVFWLTNPDDRDARNRLAVEEAPIVLSTVHSAKGLEFPYVLLYGIPKDKEAEEIRKLIYVGMTRATDHLTVVTNRFNPLAEDFKKAIVQ